HALITDFDAQGIEKDHWIHGLQRSLLPGTYLVHHCLSDRTDEVVRDVCAVLFKQKGTNLPYRHAAGIHRDDFVVKAREAALVLGNQYRREATVPVSWDVQF